MGSIANVMGNSTKVARKVYVHTSDFTVRPREYNHPIDHFSPKPAAEFKP